jgi:hypothetical protein
MERTALCFAALLCLQTISPAYAQQSLNYFTASAPASFPVDGMTELRMLNEKAYRNFIAVYGSTEEMNVHVEAGNTFVSCVIDGIRMRILYNKKGRQVYAIKYLTADRLPMDVAELVKEEFGKYEVIRAMEITAEKGTAHLVDIRYKNKCKTIRIADNRFDVYKEFISQD